jgi:hypothetical protein
MKLFRFALNIWITLVSLLSFLLGWVVLAHSPKPVQPSTQPVVNVAPLPTLAPLDSLPPNGNSNPGFQSFQVPNNAFVNAPQPIFRTGGS